MGTGQHDDVAAATRSVKSKDRVAAVVCRVSNDLALPHSDMTAVTTDAVLC